MSELTTQEKIDVWEKVRKGESMKHFNELKPDEHERLSLLLEELGEAQQMLGKILWEGYESKNPDAINQFTNRELLERELGDVSLAIDLMMQSGDIEKLHIRNHAAGKRQRIGKYLHHNKVTPD